MKPLHLLLLSLLLATPLSAQTLRNSNNTNIGKIESDGTIRNSNNSNIGKAEISDKRLAAVIFFFGYLLM